MTHQIIRRLQRLPKQPMTFQGEAFAWPCPVQIGTEPPLQPIIPVWLDLDSQLIHASRAILPGEDTNRAMLEELDGFVTVLLHNQACPQRLQVCNAELAEYLRRELKDTGIEVQLVEQLPELQAVLAEMVEQASIEENGPPGLLESRGVTVERVRAFAKAAADFYRAAPWRYLCDTDLIHVEAPKPPRGMACLTVLGAGRSMYGLGLYASRTAYDRFARAAGELDFGEHSLTGVSHVSFDAPDELPLDDAALWRQHTLPVAGENAYPNVMKYDAQLQATRPSKKELTFLEGLLQAIAETSEQEIDAGRWSKQVTTSDGPQVFTLAIPDLLAPPGPTEWIQRGFEPDQRAHERKFADIGRVLATHALDDGTVSQTLQQLFVGRSLDDLVTQPNTPAERAQELCFQAFEVHGRRQRQLARQALQLDPDCADAHVILAEAAGTLADGIQHYQNGLQAAARVLGTAFFAEHVGHFWGIQETRPYMRAKCGLAELLAEAGQRDEAIIHYQELLQLNPNDNQGVRYLMIAELLLADRDADAARLLEQYEERSACWAYARALLAFRLDSRGDTAHRLLRDALRVNPHVPAVVTSEAPVPRPAAYRPGSVEEACFVAETLQAVYRATPGAMNWIAESARDHETKLRTARQEKRRKERKKHPKKRKP